MSFGFFRVQFIDNISLRPIPYITKKLGNFQGGDRTAAWIGVYDFLFYGLWVVDEFTAEITYLQNKQIVENKQTEKNKQTDRKERNETE